MNEPYGKFAAIDEDGDVVGGYDTLEEAIQAAERAAKNYAVSVSVYERVEIVEDSHVA